jgi:transcription initiation factor TFIID subunit 3
MKGPAEPVAQDGEGDGDGEDSRPPSSGLSSVGDRLGDDMDLS